MQNKGYNIYQSITNQDWPLA